MTTGLERTEASSYTIDDLLTLVKSGSIRIPHFQRGQRWDRGDVAKLFDSIYKGYPIGTLLLWKRAAPPGDVRLGPVRIKAPNRSDALWVVDGQQRITSLAAALLPVDGAAPTTTELYFDLVGQRFVWEPPTGPLNHHLPVRDAYKLPKVMAWLRERDLDIAIEDRAYKLADRLRNYEIPSYRVVVEREGDLGPLREIFDRINTFGKRMTRAEVFHALTATGNGEGRDLSDLSGRIANSRYGAIPDSTLMMCVLGVRGPDVLRDFRSELSNDADLLSLAVGHAEAAINHTFAFLRNEALVPHLDLVPYQHLLVTLVRFFAIHQDPSEWERVLLRRWYWRAAVHGPLPKLGSTGTLRLALNAIGEDLSAIQTVIALLQEFPCKPRPVEVGAMHWNRADAKTTLCALAHLQPLAPDMSNGASPQEIDIAEALTIDRKAALPRVFDHSAPRGASSSVANRVFWSPVANEDPALGLASSERQVLQSHAVFGASADALRRGDSEAFVAARKKDIQRTVANFVAARAEWERQTRPALESL